MIGCLRTHVCKQPIIALYFESETVIKFYNLEAGNNIVMMLMQQYGFNTVPASLNMKSL